MSAEKPSQRENPLNLRRWVLKIIGDFFPLLVAVSFPRSFLSLKFHRSLSSAPPLPLHFPSSHSP